MAGSGRPGRDQDAGSGGEGAPAGGANPPGGPGSLGPALTGSREGRHLQDYRIKATAAGGRLRAMGAVITESVRAVQTVQRALPLAAAAMGRLMAGAVFLSADFKGDAFVHLEVDGGGPLGRVMAEGYADGMLRGRVDSPDAVLPLRPDGKLDVGQAVGRAGQLKVRRHLDNGGIYTSYVPLASGEIGIDLARYFTESEQVPSAVAVGVLVGRDGLVAGAGGLLVQTLPDAPAPLLDEVTERLRELGSVSHPIAEGATAEALLREVLPGPIRFSEPDRLRFGCRCDRSDLKPLLLALPLEEREEMAKNGGAEVVCRYCRTAYRYDSADLGRLSRD